MTDHDQPFEQSNSTLKLQASSPKRFCCDIHSELERPVPEVEIPPHLTIRRKNFEFNFCAWASKQMIQVAYLKGGLKEVLLSVATSSGTGSKGVGPGYEVIVQCDRRFRQTDKCRLDPWRTAVKEFGNFSKLSATAATTVQTVTGDGRAVDTVIYRIVERRESDGVNAGGDKKQLRWSMSMPKKKTKSSEIKRKSSTKTTNGS
ncbi:hypothetical protein L218DRAFT_944560 [Marasmius fiardii PR-910]|nr:hypothetical protein L218DRAFT_944560 [Marasmius fiardii PR-910]